MCNNCTFDTEMKIQIFYLKSRYPTFVSTLPLWMFIFSPEPTLLFYSLTAASLHIWPCSHLNIEKILSIKLESAPPTLISVSLSHGNGSIGSIASSRYSIGIFGFERSN